MSTQSATTTISHEVTVAVGVFAPGHLGELTQYLPFEVVDDVLAQTGTVSGGCAVCHHAPGCTSSSRSACSRGWAMGGYGAS